MYKSEQLMLPVEIRPEETVYWFNCVERQRWSLFGRRIVRQSIMDSERAFMPAMTTIKVEDIDKLRDVNLRYALRFAAAADAIGMVQDRPGHSYGHFVSVDATDGGLDSRFLGAVYSGVVESGRDSFLEFIKSAEPKE